MEKIEVSLKHRPGPIDRPFERFYLSSMKYRLWRFLIAPVYLLASIYLLGDHPITWIAVGFVVFFILIWTKAYIKFHRAVRAPFDDEPVVDSVFVATPEGFTIDPEEDEEIIEWSILSRFDESRNFFAFTIEGYPTITLGKRHFSSDEANFVRKHAGRTRARK